LVIRIRGVKDISAQQKLILNKLKLRNVNTAVFLQGTEANLRLLNRIENYITWGEPNKKIVTELIYKKLYAKIEEQRVQVKSNELV
jgi:large subunit ribosomal protein L7e